MMIEVVTQHRFLWWTWTTRRWEPIDDASVQGVRAWLSRVREAGLS